MISVNERCPADHRCPLLRRCPAGAITQSGFAPPAIDDELCTQCGLCIRSCPMKAVEGTV